MLLHKVVLAKSKAPNKARTGRLRLCAFFGAFLELWQFSVT
jgi:hypothetical protein